MKIRSMFTILAAALILAVGSISLTAAPAPQAGGAAGDAQITLTGCLEGAAGAFTLTTEGGEKYAVMGSADLAKHVGHTVKITGTKGDDTGKLSVKAQKIEHVSPSCAK